MLDCTYRLQIQHRPGQLALVVTAIAEGGGLIGDVVTIAVGGEATVREITVEVRDMTQADAIAELVRGAGAAVLWYTDRALLRHEGGKLTIEPRQPVRTVQEMRDVYTPGVARVSLAIADQPALAGRYTMIGRCVAICTDGSRVLGLGAIGPVAAMPVMEGKAVFYRQFAGISAMPVLIDAPDPDTFVETVCRIAPTFGGIHLEDISAPACFEIERRLVAALDKPVMHDDVHGTAVVTLAAAMAACRQVGLDFGSAVVGQLGLGAAGYGIASLMAESGAGRVVAFDPDEAARAHATAGTRIETADLATVLAEADVVVATTGRPDSISPDQIRPGQVILALSNPDPEIDPAAARAAGAAFAADGRSVNNVLGYPGIFRGALLSGASVINLEMKLAAARAIAQMTHDSELVPDALDPAVHQQVATAVFDAAVATGVARPERVPAGL